MNALCMYGMIGGDKGKNGAGEPIDFKQCFESIKENIIEPNECDVFLHNWNPEYANELKDLYKPKAYKIEPQIRFRTKKKDYYGKRDEFICQSRWYSHKQVLNIKKAYEEVFNVKYDWVMVCRYDLMVFTKFDFSELNEGKVYVSHFNNFGANADKENQTLKNKRLLDMWFIGSSDFMDKFADLYNSIGKYNLTDPHRTSWDFIESFTDPKEVIEFKYYRWYDYEIYRKLKGSKK